METTWDPFRQNITRKVQDEINDLVVLTSESLSGGLYHAVVDINLVMYLCLSSMEFFQLSNTQNISYILYFYFWYIPFEWVFVESYET